MSSMLPVQEGDNDSYINFLVCNAHVYVCQCSRTIILQTMMQYETEVFIPTCI